MKILALILLISLITTPLALAENELEVNILSPQHLAQLNTTNITLSAEMNKAGEMSYKLDNNNFSLACSNCSNFTKELTLESGQHTIHVLGEADNESRIRAVLFIINGSQQEELEVTINSPNNLQVFNTTNIIISAQMNKEGTISYKIDNDNFTMICEICSNFTRTIMTTGGTHQLFIMGNTTDETKIVSTFFVINLTSLNPDNSTENNQTNASAGARFSLGFHKLPKQFAKGEISSEELTEIIRNNKLNPGTINRLAKTGKLSQENIDAIIETQFLPPGILNKLLGLIGFAGNNHLEDFLNNTNLTDKQLSKLIEKNEIPKKTLKKLINKELGENSINSLVRKSDEKLLLLLIKKQTLTSSNIKNIIQNNPTEKIFNELIKNQILSEENINSIIAIIDAGLNQELEKHQKLTREQKWRLNIKEEKQKLTDKTVLIGLQKSPREDQKNNEKASNPNKENNKINLKHGKEKDKAIQNKK
ncbi:hypothetical protein HYV50_04925 [Candidatus Pacearchaeota archaeon]|nr:hypothetical protein [Candidatus Pacearchaeota archaeon]